MRAAGKYLFLLGLVATPNIGTAAMYGSEVGEIYRAPSLDGLTGLLSMNLPYTMGPGMTLVVGGSYAGALDNTYESLTTLVAALRIGFSENVEIGFKGMTHSLEPTTGDTENGIGDTEAMIKWKFREQNENLPAMALGLGFIAPTGDEDKGFTIAENWGLKFAVTGGAELPVFEDGYLGLYGEAQAVAIDKIGDTTPYSDMFGVINFGIAIPISDDNHLSFFVEYNKILKRDVLLGDSTALTPGLRFAHPNFSLTVAAQTVSYDDLPGDSQRRVVGSLSVGF